ncbi:MAG: hypothetical protein AAFV69_15330, partial [Pseudomonadota bacterium]
FFRAKSSVELNTSKKTATTDDGSATFSSIEVYETSNHNDTIRGSDRAETFLAGDGDDIIRSAGGADTLEGGAGDDVFQYRRRDVIDSDGDHRGVDVITDYGVGDVIDLSDITRGDNSGVSLVQTETGLMITADINGTQTAIAELVGVSDVSVVVFGSDSEMLA